MQTDGQTAFQLYIVDYVYYAIKSTKANNSSAAFDVHMAMLHIRKQS